MVADSKLLDNELITMSSLPAHLADLERFSNWILPTDAERVHRRMSASMEEARSFYDAVAQRVPDLLEFIDRFPLSDLPPQAKNAWYLLASFIQAAMAVEMWRSTIFKYGLDETRNKRLSLHNSHPLL